MLIVKFWESFLKSKLTKRKFVNLLISNLKKKWVKNIFFKSAYLEIHDSINPKIIANTFGVQKVEVVSKYTFWEKPLEEILNVVVNKVKEFSKINEIKNFRISAKREYKNFPLNSLELQQIIWKKIEKDLNIKANYKEFDLEIKIKILKDGFFVWTNFDEIQWLWGLPYWIEWKALNLFSWWIDSPVATFLSAKRWIKQDFLFLNIPSSDLLLQQVFKIYTFLKNQYQIEWNFYEIKIWEYIKEIKKKIPAWTRQIIFKFFLYKLANKFANFLKVPAIITWENLWQVSTQTLTNLALLDKISNKLILRPLITFDKIEIIKIAKDIWTYNLSIQINETCSLENHSNSKFTDFEKLQKLYNSLQFNEDEIINWVKKIEKIQYFDFEKIKTNKPIWEVIDLSKNSDFKLDKNKTYTFKCFSWYQASQKAYEYSKQWFKVYRM